MAVALMIIYLIMYLAEIVIVSSIVSFHITRGLGGEVGGAKEDKEAGSNVDVLTTVVLDMAWEG